MRHVPGCDRRTAMRRPRRGERSARPGRGVACGRRRRARGGRKARRAASAAAATRRHRRARIGPASASPHHGARSTASQASGRRLQSACARDSRSCTACRWPSLSRSTAVKSMSASRNAGRIGRDGNARAPGSRRHRPASSASRTRADDTLRLVGGRRAWRSRSRPCRQGLRGRSAAANATAPRAGSLTQPSTRWNVAFIQRTIGLRAEVAPQCQRSTGSRRCTRQVAPRRRGSPRPRGSGRSTASGHRPRKSFARRRRGPALGEPLEQPQLRGGRILEFVQEQMVTRESMRSRRSLGASSAPSADSAARLPCTKSTAPSSRNTSSRWATAALRQAISASTTRHAASPGVAGAGRPPAAASDWSRPGTSASSRTTPSFPTCARAGDCRRRPARPSGSRCSC